MKTYPEGLKEQMVRRMLAPSGMGVRELAKETDFEVSAVEVEVDEGDKAGRERLDRE